MPSLVVQVTGDFSCQLPHLSGLPCTSAGLEEGDWAVDDRLLDSAKYHIIALYKCYVPSALRSQAL